MSVETISIQKLQNIIQGLVFEAKSLGGPGITRRIVRAEEFFSRFGVVQPKIRDLRAIINVMHVVNNQMETGSRTEILQALQDAMEKTKSWYESMEQEKINADMDGFVRQVGGEIAKHQKIDSTLASTLKLYKTRMDTVEKLNFAKQEQMEVDETPLADQASARVEYLQEKHLELLEELKDVQNHMQKVGQMLAEIQAKHLVFVKKERYLQNMITFIKNYISLKLPRQSSVQEGDADNLPLNFKTKPEIEFTQEGSIQDQVAKAWSETGSSVEINDWQCSDEYSVNFSAQQEFLINYVTPKNMLGLGFRGFMVLHSAGSGKTASALAVASIFRIRNFMPLIVTTPGNAGENKTGAEMYTHTAIWNQTDIAAAKYGDVVSAYASETGDLNPTDKAVVEWGLSKKGILNTPNETPDKPDIKFSRSAQIMTFARFTNLCKGLSPKNPDLVHLKSHSKNAISRCCSGHFLCSKFIIFDEVHKILTSNASSETGNFRIIRDAIWECQRQCSEHNCAGPFLLLLTATPCPESGLDLIYLTQLIKSEAECQELGIASFATSSNSNRNEDFASVKQADNAVYAKDYQTRIETLSAALDGQISYLDNQSDTSRYPSKKLFYHPVVLPAQVTRNFRARFKSLKAKSNALVWTFAKDDGSSKLYQTALERSNFDKQQRNYLFIDNAGNHGTHTRLVEENLLEAMKSKFGTEFVPVRTVADHQENIPPEQQVIILTKSGQPKKDLIKLFNQKKCNHILLSRVYKEGVSLYNVEKVHIVGFIFNKADLKQATARAFRNCKSTDLPYGTVVEIHCTYPKQFSDGIAFRTEMASTLGGSVQTKDLADSLEHMKDMIRNQAVDKYLNKSINDKSFEYDQELGKLFTEGGVSAVASGEDGVSEENFFASNSQSTPENYAEKLFMKASIGSGGFGDILGQIISQSLKQRMQIG